MLALSGLILPQKGQPQCNAGVVIMGYPGDPLYEAGSAEARPYPTGYPGDSLHEAGSAQARPAWTRDGSLMVFRKLKQMVPEFRKYVRDAGPKWREWMPSEEVEDMKKLNPPFADAEGEDLYGARLVGRWKSVRTSTYNIKTHKVLMVESLVGSANSQGPVSR